MGVKEAMSKVGEYLSGGAAGAAAEKLKERPKKIDDEIERATSGAPAKPASAPSKNDMNPAGIRFAKGGMVRRGYGKARGA